MQQKEFYGHPNKGENMKNKLFLDLATSLAEKEQVNILENSKNNIKTSFINVDSVSKNKYKRSEGEYWTISWEKDLLEKKAKIIKKRISSILKKFINKGDKKKTLIIGLGNSSILADAIGPNTTNKIIATNHYEDFLDIPKVALFVPEVIGKTGISSFRLIKMVVNNLQPDSIIIIDSLATTSLSRLDSCIEISNAGIIPGSAIKSNKAIDKETFNIPVIAIGVPLVFSEKNFFLTSTNIKSVIELISTILAEAINEVFLFN